MAPSTTKVVLVSFLLCMTLLKGITCSKVWIVGGVNGWGYGILYDSWPKGKTFTARDQLVFTYNPKKHDLTLVTKEEFQACRKSSTSVTLTTGNDRILVKPGWNYFISTVEDDCQVGIKMALYGN